MLLALSAMVSLAYAHVDCYLTIDDLWTCYGVFQTKRPMLLPPRGQPLCPLCGHVLGNMCVWISIQERTVQPLLTKLRLSERLYYLNACVRYNA